MDRNQLEAVKNILFMLEDASDKLYERLDVLNLTETERRTIEDALFVLGEKLISIRRSKINELENHVNIYDVNNIY